MDEELDEGVEVLALEEPAGGERDCPALRQQLGDLRPRLLQGGCDGTYGVPDSHTRYLRVILSGKNDPGDLDGLARAGQVNDLNPLA